MSPGSGQAVPPNPTPAGSRRRVLRLFQTPELLRQEGVSGCNCRLLTKRQQSESGEMASRGKREGHIHMHLKMFTHPRDSALCV